MIDFTINSYSKLLDKLCEKYEFRTFRDFITEPKENINTAVLRHDIDAKKENALKFAEIQNAKGVVGSYYFRVIPQSYNKKLIEKIANYGHEIGYHYEDVDLVLKKKRSQVLDQNKEVNEDKLINCAYESFLKNLDFLRSNFDIKTICMHGSPRSKYDNKLIWKKFNYKSLGIVGEPYYDTNWNEVGYLTDTGRKWNGEKVSIRDKVKSSYSFNFSTSFDIMSNIDDLPNKMMFTFHPQRWNENVISWTTELINQNFKNVLKWIILNNKNKKRIA